MATRGRLADALAIGQLPADVELPISLKRLRLNHGADGLVIEIDEKERGSTCTSLRRIGSGKVNPTHAHSEETEESHQEGPGFLPLPPLVH